MNTARFFAFGVGLLTLLSLALSGAGHSIASRPAASAYTLATANGFALSLSSEGRVTGLQLDGGELVSTSAPALWLRDLSDAGQVTKPNLVVNPGFEEGLAGWAQLTNGGLDVSVVVSPTHSGDASLQFASTSELPAFAAGAGDPVPVVPGQRYRISAWWRSATGYVSATDGPPSLWQMTLWRGPYRTSGLYVQWLDGDSRPLGDPQLAVPLHWNAATWRLIRRELTAPADAAFARAVVAARLQAEETLWIDDVAFVPSPEPDLAVSGSVAPCATGASAADSTCLVQTATLTNGLSLTVTYTAHVDHIAIQGEVWDLDGRERALDVSWGVPVDLTPHPRRLRRHPLLPLLQGEGGGGQGEGGEVWTWWDDAHTSRPITDTTTYAHAISAVYDAWLPMSLYPYAGVSTAVGGLAMGVPLDRPQIALLTYDGAARRYEATYHMGISPQAARAGPRATFALMLYRFDPTWGFRDVIARHRALQPEAHTTTRSLYDYAGAQQGWYFTQHGVEQALAHDAANIYSAQYTVGELPLKLAPKTDPRPTLDEALGVVSDTLSSPVPSDAALARAINGSAVVDPNGDWSLKKLGVFEWAPEWWEAIWAANLDPDLEDGLASWILDWRVTPAFTATTEAGAHLDGVQMDNFMSPPALDLRPEALAVADRSLSYTPHTYRPAVHNGFSYHEYLTSLRDYLDSEWGTDRDISINFWGLGNPNYLASYIDAFGSEGNLRGNGEGENWTPEILDYRRAIAYSRPYLFANQTDALTATEAYTFSQTALLYGVRPRRGPNASPWEPEVEQMISDTVELITRYWAAGWEPLTYARTDGDDVWIERFGDLSPTPRPEGHPPPPLLPGEGEGDQGEGGEVFFPVHNRTDLTRTATVTIEAVPLGITYPTSVEITDLATEQPVPFSVEAGNIVVSLDLGPRETRVLQVSGGTTPPASECVGDANGIGDVVDVMATASELPCQVYLPLVAAQWRQPWPSPTAGPPYPRLARLTWYEPGNFAHSLSERTDGRITIDDPNHTALVDILAAHQLVVVSGRVLSGSYPGVQTDRGRLAQARDEAGFLLLGRWETSGIELYDLSFTNTQPGSPFPFVPEWFVQEVAGPLPQAVWAGDTVVPIADGEQNAYCFLRENYLNDQVIILDGDRSEAVKLDCDVWDGSSLTIPLTLDSALRSPYDFGLFKSDHAAGTPVRINTSPSWDAWWGYNMTDIGPTYRCTVKTLPVLCSGSFAAATGERIR